MIYVLSGWAEVIFIAYQSVLRVPALSTQNGSRATECRSNCTLIVERISNLRSSPSCARLLESIKRARLCITRKPTASASDTIADLSRCSTALCVVNRMSESRSSRQCFNRIAHQCQRRRALRHTASRSTVKCACLWISAHRCRSRLAKRVHSLPSSQRTWSGPT